MIISANAAVIAASAAVMSSRHGGGFHGTGLQFFVLMTLVGTLTGLFVGLFTALTEHSDLKERIGTIIAFMFVCSAVMALLTGGILGIIKIVEMI